MQSAFTSLPELEAGGGDGKAAPVVGTLHGLSGQFGGFFYKGADDFHPAADNAALRGYSCADPAFVGSGGEVGVRFTGSASLRYTLDVYLSLQLMPDEREGDVGIGRELPSLAAFVVGEEDESAVFHAFQQDGAGRGAAVGRDGGRNHGRRFVLAAMQGIVEPAGELFERVLRDGVTGELAFLIFFSYVRELGVHIITVYQYNNEKTKGLKRMGRTCLILYISFEFGILYVFYCEKFAILDVYEKQGIKNGHPQNKMKGEAFKTPLATAYPDCRLVVTKETMTVEGMIKIVYDLLKEKLNIAKITFTSGVNTGSAEFDTKNDIERCPLCGISLNEEGVCPKCGYKKQ